MIKMNNVPCGYQNQFDTQDVFILLHMLIKNKEYRDYYLNPENDFNLIILDNSAYELGKSLDKKLLLEWGDKLKRAHPAAKIELVIPDVYGDCSPTISLMEGFLVGEIPFKLMGVPQGRNKEELLSCLREMMEQRKITCIGLNKLWTEDMLDYIIPYIMLRGKEIHKLGVNNLSDWCIPKMKQIRSADSRILAKLVTGKDDPWNCKLTSIQITILKNLIEEVNKW